MVVENTIYCIGGIGGKGGTYEKRLDTVNGDFVRKSNAFAAGRVLAVGRGGGEEVEAAGKHVHAKIFTHMRGEILSKSTLK